MIRYARTAVPWRLVVAVGLVCLLELQAMTIRPTKLWPLEGCALGLAAGAAAWCFDESAAAVVDSAPRHLAWRTSARLAGPLALACCWCLAVATARSAFAGHALAVSMHGAAAVATASAFATWRRARGAATPGMAIGSMVVAVCAFLALVRPWPLQIPVFPYLYGGPWTSANRLWLGLALLSWVVAAILLTDRGWRTAPAAG
jgi:hypothetical protein